MFDDLRKAFREAVRNFKDELSREEIPETVDRILLSMRHEVGVAKGRVSELEVLIARTVAEAEVERAEAVTAHRRGKRAADIGDAETSEIAIRYARKHEERIRVLDQKAVALRDELVLRHREVEEMLVQVKEAQEKRNALGATAARSGARDSFTAADDLFGELDRMANKIADEDARGRTGGSFGDLDLLGEDFAPSAPPPDVEARLEELKRRMRGE
jgi:phage shock protein A